MRLVAANRPCRMTSLIWAEPICQPDVIALPVARQSCKECLAEQGTP
jgi:hypothetical protein